MGDFVACRSGEQPCLQANIGLHSQGRFVLTVFIRDLLEILLAFFRLAQGEEFEFVSNDFTRLAAEMIVYFFVFRDTCRK